MQACQTTPNVYHWKPWTQVFKWQGLVLFALCDAFSGSATLDELSDVIGRHPRAFGARRRKERIRKILESNPDKFVLNEKGRWTFVHEDSVGFAVAFFKEEALATWRHQVPRDLRHTIEALWPSQGEGSPNQ